MSDKTVFNQNLVLNHLTVNNATDSAASGYVPHSTIISPIGMTCGGDIVIPSGAQLVLQSPGTSVAITNNGGVIYSNNNIDVAGSLTAANGVYTALVAIGNNGTAGPNLIINSNGTQIQMKGLSTENILIQNSSAGYINTPVLSLTQVGTGNSVSLACDSPAVLSVGGAVNATFYSNGIGGLTIILQVGSANAYGDTSAIIVNVPNFTFAASPYGCVSVSITNASQALIVIANPIAGTNEVSIIFYNPSSITIGSQIIGISLVAYNIPN